MFVLVVLGLSQEIDWKEHFQNYPFCVGWDVGCKNLISVNKVHLTD